MGGYWWYISEVRRYSDSHQQSTLMSSLRHSLLLITLLTSALTEYQNSCETLSTSLHLVKEEYSKGKELVRSCEDEVSMNKCEGSCVSTTRPSAMERSGFSKDCSCCRESSYTEKTVTLQHCYDEDGERIQSGSLASMQVTIKQPTGCLCFKCGSALP